MISKIIWELRADKSIKKATKLTNRLYANGKASAEYSLISDAILPTDTVKMILNINGKEYHKLLAYGNVLLETGEIVKGWSIVSNGEELAVEIEDNGYETMIVSFEIKRFSTFDSNTVLSTYTSAEDDILIYASSSYTPMIEPTDAELLESEISKINVKLNNKVDSRVETSTADSYIKNITNNDDNLIIRVANKNNKDTKVIFNPDITKIETWHSYTEQQGGKPPIEVVKTSNVTVKAEEVTVNHNGVEGRIATTTDIENSATVLETYIDEKIENIKKSAGYVFDTFDNFTKWIAGTYVRDDGVVVNDLNIGDDIFIIEEGIPDYWVKSKSTPMTITDFSPYSSGDYYTKSEVEEKLKTVFDNITYIDNSYGEQNVLYDTDDGITIMQTTRIVSGDNNSDISSELTIPLVGSEEIVFDATEDGSHIQAHLDMDITNKLARTLVTPISRPINTELVAVDNTGSQTMIEIGEGLKIENGTLKADYTTVLNTEV